MVATADGVAVPRIGDLIALRHGARHLVLFPKKQSLAATAGNYRSRFRGRGMDFDEVRPYQPGDDIRTIDWRVTARTTRPHTKVFREERERPLLIAVDLRSQMFFGSRRLKSIVAAEIATTLAWAGLDANDRVGGMIFSPRRQRDVRGQRSHHSVLRFIHSLGEACGELLEHAEDEIPMSQILENVCRVAAPGTSVLIVSDFHDIGTDAEKQLFPLVRHCDVTFAWVRDPLEIELPPPGEYVVSNGRQRQTLNTRHSKLRERFHQQQLRRQQHLETMSRRLGAGLLRFSTATPVLPELIKHYGGKRRGKS